MENLTNIKLKGAKNCRDLGGIKTTSGKTVKTGMLLRGAELSKIKGDSPTLLVRKYHLKNIIDLRTDLECEEHPDKKIPDTNYYHFPVFDDAIAGLSHERKVKSLATLKVMPDMQTLYKSMVNGKCIDNIANILKFILEQTQPDQAVLFHCSAGKDRTGIISALLYLFLGVDKESIYKDYLQTNKGRMFKSTASYLGLILITFDPIFAYKIKHYLIADKKYLQAALENIENQFGSIQNFFTQKLGYSAEKQEELKAKFLE